MQFRPTTVLGLFDSSQKHFVIPVYQRAYSWDLENWNTFLNDLKEQINGDNNYFYGNLLLETLKKDVTVSREAVISRINGIPDNLCE